MHAEASIRFEGSSPLTRGKPVARCSVSGGGWLIPTHAGKTDTAEALVSDRPAHPHSRGENAPGIASPSWFQGSSPLARGKQCQHEIEGHQAGLIPTHVGKTNSCAGSTGRTWVHPRPRGENLWRAFRKGMAWGSSPLTRGKLCLAFWCFFLCGLIPAHAGKTLGRLPALAPASAHPRSRGENARAGALRHACAGSSPLTRGKRPSGCPETCLRGLIPAHAGKTDAGRRALRL